MVKQSSACTRPINDLLKPATSSGLNGFRLSGGWAWQRVQTPISTPHRAPWLLILALRLLANIGLPTV